MRSLREQYAIEDNKRQVKLDNMKFLKQQAKAGKIIVAHNFSTKNRNYEMGIDVWVNKNHVELTTEEEEFICTLPNVTHRNRWIDPGPY